MKEATIKSLPINGQLTPIEQLSQLIEKEDIAFLKVECINWPQYSYKPETYVKLVQLSDGFYLHFNVFESNVKALITTDNGPVYKDSCVECFIDPIGDGFYYNFEFNCIGTALLGFGNSRHTREVASEEIMSGIKRISSLCDKLIEEITDPLWWNLHVFIPYTCFYKHQLAGLGINSAGNFYKCGDATKFPHYLSWNPVESVNPDFHRPECFGKLKIE